MPAENIIQPDQSKDIAVQRSELTQEIVSRKPGLLLRWGNLIFLMVMILFVITTWFIRYPDVIRATAKLTSINAPKPVVSLIGGKIVKLHVNESQMVQAGDILGFMESTAHHRDVLLIDSSMDTLQKIISNGRMEYMREYFNNNALSLGELQSAYEHFLQTALSFNNYLSDGFYLTKKRLLLRDKANLLKLHVNLSEQMKLQEQDLTLTQKTFDANESLKRDNVISDFDYRLEQSKLISKKLTLPQVKSAIISNESQQIEKEKEIMELENEIVQQKAIFQQSLSTFKSQIDDWKKKYILIAPIAGKVAFASFVEENQQSQINQVICFINPENSEYYAEVIIPQSNFGKVRIDQQVLLKFQSYPFQEYGSVMGRIDFISHIPDEKGYLARVVLINGLNTTYKKQVQYRDGLTADAEIITTEMRLLERFYYSILKQVRK